MDRQKWPRNVFVILPDLLTWSRVFIGLLIGLAGPLIGRDGVVLVMKLLLLGWTTDILDGRIARYAKKRYRRPESWTGRNEIRFDAVMLIGVFAYLGYARFIPLWATSYAALLFLLVVLPVSYSKIFLFEAPAAIATFLLLVIFAGRPTLGYVMIWGSLLLIYDWRRAMQLGGRLRVLLRRTAKGIARFFLTMVSLIAFSVV